MNVTRRLLLGSTAVLAAPHARRRPGNSNPVAPRSPGGADAGRGRRPDGGLAPRNAAEIGWTTFDIGPLQDRLLREASLPQTDFGVGYLLNSRATAQTANLLEPLDALLQSDPIEAYDDIAPGLRGAMQVGGRTIAIPVRHATNGLFCNMEMLAAAGIGAPPSSFEEFLDQCRRVAGRRGDGPPVAGLVMTAALASYPVIFARAFGGDFITEDFKVIPDRDAMVKAITAIRGLFESGGLPRSSRPSPTRTR